MDETPALVECVAFALVIGTFLISRRWARPVHARTMRVLGRIGRRPLVAAIVLGAGTTLFCAVHAAFVLWPEPTIHDEFAYLLGADTFAGGELTRPTHEFWRHFETYHILHQPSYAPKYPPGQSLSLALGEVIAGEPRVGLWVQMGAMVGALTWMLAGWLPGRWAVLGGVVIALVQAVCGTWVQTFFGGGLAATGGALVLGALPRIASRPTAVHAVVLAVGLSILAVTRPFEGMITSLPVAVALLVVWWRGPAERRVAFTARVVAPIVMVLGVTGVGIAAHNHAVTGDATRLPYVEYDAQYSIYPAFLSQKITPRDDYRHRQIERFMKGFQAGDYHRDRSVLGRAKLTVKRCWKLLGGLVGAVPIIALLLPLLLRMVPRLRKRFVRGPSVVVPLAIVGAVAMASALTTYSSPHYAAPALGALLVLTMVGWRWLARLSGRERAVGPRLALGMVVGLVAIAGHRARIDRHVGVRYFGSVRASIRDRLLAEPGRDLVLVNAEPTSSVHHEFVFNSADIDASEIVWARRIDPPTDAELFQYFSDRHIWTLHFVSLENHSYELKRLRSPRHASESD